MINECVFFDGDMKLNSYDYKVNIKILKNPSIEQLKNLISTADIRFLITMDGDLYIWDGKVAIHDDVIFNFFGITPLYMKGIFKENCIAISNYISNFELKVNASLISTTVLDNLWESCENIFKNLYGEHYHLVENNGFLE